MPSTAAMGRDYTRRRNASVNEEVVQRIEEEAAPPDAESPSSFLNLEQDNNAEVNVLPLYATKIYRGYSIVA
jgi:hypothetical protein